MTNEPRYGILQTNQERGAYMDKFYRVEVWKTIADPKTNITYLQQEQQDGYLDMSKAEDKEQYKTILRSCVKKIGLYFGKFSPNEDYIFRFAPVDSIPMQNEPENQIQNPENDSEN